MMVLKFREIFLESKHCGKYLGKGNQECCFERVKFKIPTRHSNVRVLVINWIYKSESQRREVRVRDINFGRH